MVDHQILNENIPDPVIHARFLARLLGNSAAVHLQNYHGYVGAM